TITPAALLYYHVHYYGGTGFPSVEFNLADTVTYRQISSSARVSYFRALQDGDFKEMGDQVVYSFNVAWGLP
ncbi:MAG: hypothetical protein HYR80_05120, partial [Nitrospirae bacterium]|nr:hypothetical protein [Nitrospirota bacterium]